MNCPNCNGRVEDSSTRCKLCGADLSIYRKIFSLSNYYYNDGLNKAKVRDLSGAIFILRKSLELNKKNTDARNLLGLIYFEMGETVAALSSWVISKHFQPEDNIADQYINSIQKNAMKLDTLNQAIKKYNIALQSAKVGNEDLAILQLKKVVSLNPRYLRALQLLALLYMKNNDTARAMKYLEKAKHIDVSNTKTLNYLEEIIRAHTEVEAVNEEEDSTTLKDTGASFMPISSYKEEKPNVRAWLNLILGAVIGIAVGYYLFVPAAKNRITAEYNAENKDYSENLSYYTAQIASLEKERDSLQSQLDMLNLQLEGIQGTRYDDNVYDNLFDAFSLYMAELEKPEAEQDMQEVAKLLLDVNEDALENESAKSIYNMMKDTTFVGVAATLYEEGHDLYTNGKYEDAITVLKQSYDYNSKDESTIYFLGRAYQRMNDYEKATKYYNKIIKDFKDTSRYTEAKQRLAEME